MTVEELIARLKKMPKNAVVMVTVSERMAPMASWSFGEGEFSVIKYSDYIVDIYAEDKSD